MKRLWQWVFRPDPRRFLAAWYAVWLAYSLKGFFVNWLIRHQPIRIAWAPVTGAVETAYLLAEIVVVAIIVWQAWRFEKADWRLAAGYEWYSLIEIGLSALNPRLWTYAMNHMWCQSTVLFGQTVRPCPGPVVWSDTLNMLLSHLGFMIFYAFVHHGLPLLVLGQLKPRSTISSAA